MDLVVETADRIYYQSDHLELSSSVARMEHYPVHRHPLQFQLEVVLHGETECGIGRQRFAVPQHCFSVINPDVEHYNVTRRWKHAAFIIFPRQIVDETIAAYHSAFVPSKWLERPYLNLAIFVLCAETDDRALALGSPAEAWLVQTAIRKQNVPDQKDEHTP